MKKLKQNLMQGLWECAGDQDGDSLRDVLWLQLEEPIWMQLWNQIGNQLGIWDSPGVEAVYI